MEKRYIEIAVTPIVYDGFLTESRNCLYVSGIRFYIIEREANSFFKLELPYISRDKMLLLLNLKNKFQSEYKDLESRNALNSKITYKKECFRFINVLVDKIKNQLRGKKRRSQKKDKSVRRLSKKSQSNFCFVIFFTKNYVKVIKIN